MPSVRIAPSSPAMTTAAPVTGGGFSQRGTGRNRDALARVRRRLVGVRRRARTMALAPYALAVGAGLAGGPWHHGRAATPGAGRRLATLPPSLLPAAP